MEKEVNQYEANLSSSISYPLYGPLLNKSEISNSEIYVNNNIIKHKKNNQLNISENKVDSGFINEYNNKSKEESSKILRNNKNNGSRYNNTSQRYAFKPIEENKEKIINNNIYSEEDEKNNYKDQENSNDSYKENNINNKLKGKKQLKNKSKTQSNIHKNKASNSSSIKDDEDSNNNGTQIRLFGKERNLVGMGVNKWINLNKLIDREKSSKDNNPNSNGIVLNKE